MLLKEFLDLGKICKVCGSTEPKVISVEVYIDHRPCGDVELTKDYLSFRVESSDECYEIFRFYLDNHRAEKDTFNPKNLSILYANNFVFKLSCTKCAAYSFQSNIVTFHHLGSMTSEVYANSEEINLSDENGKYTIVNWIHADKICLIYTNGDKQETLPLNFMTLKDLPIRSKTKMLKKIRTLLLLS